jgi:hypothetical protein
MKYFDEVYDRYSSNDGTEDNCTCRISQTYDLAHVVYSDYALARLPRSGGPSILTDWLSGTAIRKLA